jgi:hypothetical protein
MYEEGKEGVRIGEGGSGRKTSRNRGKNLN